jgi:DNA-binding response OmpR family regulator
MDDSAPGLMPSDRQPIAPTLRPAQSLATGDRTRPVVAHGHVSRRILIAEDEPRIAELLEKGLRANGFTTVHSADGRETLGLADGGEFDLLILDIGLPGLDGFDVLVDLRSRGRTLPVIVLTGRRDRDVGEFLAEGADDYLSKPFRFDELLARIRARLR